MLLLSCQTIILIIFVFNPLLFVLVIAKHRRGAGYRVFLKLVINRQALLFCCYCRNQCRFCCYFGRRCLLLYSNRRNTIILIRLFFFNTLIFPVCQALFHLFVARFVLIVAIL